MSTEVFCELCKQRIAVPDELVGQIVQCPICENEIATTIDDGGQLPQAAELGWFMRTADGQEYGPVDQAQLDRWVAEGRVDDNCQLLREDWEQWQWAADVFPQLIPARLPETQAANNPSSQTWACPFCSERIQPSAIKCRHCGEFLDQRNEASRKAKRNCKVLMLIGGLIFLLGFSMIHQIYQDYPNLHYLPERFLFDKPGAKSGFLLIGLGMAVFFIGLLKAWLRRE